MRKIRSVAASLALAALWPLGQSPGPARADEAVPLLTPKPVFVPGLYETHSRNSRFQTQDVASRTCIASADFDAFRAETMAQYRAAPNFTAACRLSDDRDLPDGFAFAMDCRGTKTVVAFHFSKDLVADTTQTLIVDRPEVSSEILTLSRRVGDCPGQKPGHDT